MRRGGGGDAETWFAVGGALLQLGGLAWPSRNKISHPADAALLISLAVNWLRRVKCEMAFVSAKVLE